MHKCPHLNQQYYKQTKNIHKHNHTKHNETHVYNKICVAENILLIQILFEEVCFGASFEGRDRKLWWRGKETEMNICAAKNLLLVKILFRRHVLRLVLKAGKEGPNQRSEYTRHITVYVT